MITITVPQDIERLVVQRAKQSGRTLEQVAFDALAPGLDETAATPDGEDAWIARLKRLAMPAGVSLPNEALSSEASYS